MKHTRVLALLLAALLLLAGCSAGTTAPATTARNLKDGETYRVTLEALESSGVSFTVLDTTVTYHK